MTLEAALRKYLAADPTIDEIAQGRVHPVRLRLPIPQEQTAISQGLKPSIIFSLGSRRADPAGLDSLGTHLVSTFELDAWSTDYDTSVELADAIRRRLLALHAGGTIEGVSVLTVELSTESDSYEAEKGIHVRTGEYFITHVDEEV